ncbi:MAG: amidase [Acidobacteria bacterium]|nr:amidase [Acidobacteriota bacterium]
MDRRSFTALLASGQMRTPAFELNELTIPDLQKAQQSGRFTARRLTQLYLERIAAIDQRGPAMRSVIEVNPDALSIADGLDKERKGGRIRGPLHGIPILVKDNIDTAGRMRTSAGSLALAESIAAKDAPAVARLRNAGAVLLGKTNLSEWANIRSPHSTSGWSARGGLTRNPYALNRNTSGSSSGSGAATAANLCAASVGTETDGSIVSPSSICGLVGLKPTVGLISQSGIIPISRTQDTAGPMTRSVTDAALLLEAMAEPSRRQPYASGLQHDGLRGLKLGIVRKAAGFHAGMDDLLRRAIDTCRQLGAQIIDPLDIPHYGEYNDAEWEVLLYEFKDGVNSYLAGLGPSAAVKSLADIIAFNDRNRAREMPHFAQETFLQAQAKGPLSTKEYRDALAKCQRLSRLQGLDAALAKADILLAPTDSPAWVTDLINGDHYTSSFSTPAAVAGYPHLTVPMGQISGLPVGLSFVGPPFSEAALLKAAYAYEQASKLRRAPQFLDAV